MKRSFLTVLAAAAVFGVAACAQEPRDEQVQPVEETTPMPAPAPAPPPMTTDTMMMTTTDTMSTGTTGTTGTGTRTTTGM